MKQEHDILKELHKSIQDAEGAKESRQLGIGCASGCLIYACFFGFFICILVFLGDFKSKWVWLAVTTAFLVGIVVINSINSSLNKKSEKKIDDLKESTFASIIDYDRYAMKRDRIINRYFTAVKDVNLWAILKIPNEIIRIFSDEDDEYKIKQINEYLEEYLNPMTKSIEEMEHGGIDNDNIADFIKCTMATYSKIYKRYDVIEVNTEVLETLAALDGLTDPYGITVTATENRTENGEID